MTTCMLHIHRLGVLCAASMKPHSQTSLVVMCDSGEVYLEAYVRLTAYGKATAEGATSGSALQGAPENGDRTHIPSLAHPPKKNKFRTMAGTRRSPVASKFTHARDPWHTNARALSHVLT